MLFGVPIPAASGPGRPRRRQKPSCSKVWGGLVSGFGTGRVYKGFGVLGFQWFWGFRDCRGFGLRGLGFRV